MNTPLRTALALIAVVVGAYLIAGGDPATVVVAGKNVFDALAGFGAELVNRAAQSRGH